MIFVAGDCDLHLWLVDVHVVTWCQWCVQYVGIIHSGFTWLPYIKHSLKDLRLPHSKFTVH